MIKKYNIKYLFFIACLFMTKPVYAMPLIMDKGCKEVLDPEDPDDSKIDTTYMDKWECFDAFSSFDMVIEDVSSDVKRVVFGIDDTGFRVEYYFVLNGEEWYLNRIVDLSM